MYHLPNEPDELVVEDVEDPRRAIEEDDDATQDDNVREAEAIVQPPNIATKVRENDAFNVSEADTSQDCLHKLMLSKSLIRRCASTAKPTHSRKS